jgi:NADH-quinone oxidoreductase subunit G
MPKLTIDNRSIEVAEGTKVIDAAAQLGIIIPRFCYHPALGSLGACRMCAVKFQDGPVKGIEMSCMKEAKEGMVVSTTNEEVVDFRRQVIEWLMMNHPHDCPVCDEGGHCLLQDLTVAGGHGIRRFPGGKRTYLDQDLGMFVQHEMNRCIHCFRCRRFYQEFAGYRDFGALQIGSRMYFGRVKDGPLESPFSGNIIDLCPTGVLTDKPSRYKGRRWDFERSPSLCIHCSLGCRVIASARYRRMVRLESAFSQKVNGYFICDRGRFGFYYADLPQRPRRARVGNDEVTLDQALQETSQKIFRTVEKFGKEAIACQGSERSALEAQGALKLLCQKQGWSDPGFFMNPFREGAVRSAVFHSDKGSAVSLREIEQADFILVVGADPINEAPLTALAIRQAHRKGATVVVIDPRPVFLPLDFEHLSVHPDDLDLCLAILLKRTADSSTVKETGPETIRFIEALPDGFPQDYFIHQRLLNLAGLLKQSRQPTIVCGTDIVSSTTPALASDLVRLLKAQGRQAGIFNLLTGANTFGAALLSSSGASFLKTIEEIEKGSTAGLILVEADPFRLFPDRTRLAQALKKLDWLVVLDYLPTKAVQEAQIFLPTQTIFEAGGTFINQEGRAQRASSVYKGGMPVEQDGEGGPPPRLFRMDIPGAEARPAWKILTDLSLRLSPERGLLTDSLWAELARGTPVFSGLSELENPGSDVRLIPDQTEKKFLSAAGNYNKKKAPERSYELLVVDWTFGTEELSSYSAPILKAAKRPCLTMTYETAAQLGLQKGDRVTLTLDRGPLEMEVDLNDHLSDLVMVLPRHADLDWQKITGPRIKLSLDQVIKT